MSSTAWTSGASVPAGRAGLVGRHGSQDVGRVPQPAGRRQVRHGFPHRGGARPGSQVRGERALGHDRGAGCAPATATRRPAGRQWPARSPPPARAATPRRRRPGRSALPPRRLRPGRSRCASPPAPQAEQHDHGHGKRRLSGRETDRVAGVDGGEDDHGGERGVRAGVCSGRLDDGESDGDGGPSAAPRRTASCRCTECHVMFARMRTRPWASSARGDVPGANCVPASGELAVDPRVITPTWRPTFAVTMAARATSEYGRTPVPVPAGPGPEGTSGRDDRARVVSVSDDS